VTARIYYQPRSLDEALGLLAQHGPGLLVIAGGTLAMPLVNKGVSLPEAAMGLRRAGLDRITTGDHAAGIGSMVTLTQVAQANLPLLSEAAKHIGGWTIRNMGTAGGNLFAPPPAGDLAAALLALDAQIVLASKRGQRVMPLADFFTGFLMTALEPDELVVEFRVPWAGGNPAFLKHGRLHSNTPAVVTVAAQVVRSNGSVKDARIALNAVGPNPMRARMAEAALIGSKGDEAAIAAAADAAMQECEPFTDPIASEWYRRKMTGVFVKRALAQALA
jgi:aerobic carbon-monoxide dehydrogenase medium subunit